MELVVYADGVEVDTMGVLLSWWYTIIFGVFDLDEFVVGHNLVLFGPEDVGFFPGVNPAVVVTENAWVGFEGDCGRQ